MTDQQRATFPFDFIAMWVRPYQGKPEACIFCKQPAAYLMYQAVGIHQVLKGAFNFDELWRTAIQKQVDGDYSFAYYQPDCIECTQELTSIQLGKRQPIKQLLSLAELAKRQRGTELSLVLYVTVRSVDDEGDTYAMLAPNTTIEDVVKLISSKK